MLKCLQCSRVGFDIGLCGAPITCPKAGREIDPQTDIVIRCDLCDITRAVPVSTLTKHQDPRLDNACQSDVCKAYLVNAKAPPLMEVDMATGKVSKVSTRKTSPAAAGGPASTARAEQDAAADHEMGLDQGTQDTPAKD